MTHQRAYISATEVPNSCDCLPVDSKAANQFSYAKLLDLISYHPAPCLSCWFYTVRRIELSLSC
jgi:hypothetical protein